MMIDWIFKTILQIFAGWTISYWCSCSSKKNVEIFQHKIVWLNKARLNLSFIRTVVSTLGFLKWAVHFLLKGDLNFGNSHQLDTIENKKAVFFYKFVVLIKIKTNNANTNSEPGNLSLFASYAMLMKPKKGQNNCPTPRLLAIHGQSPQTADCTVCSSNTNR